MSINHVQPYFNLTSERSSVSFFLLVSFVIDVINRLCVLRQKEPRLRTSFTERPLNKGMFIYVFIYKFINFRNKSRRTTVKGCIQFLR